MMIVAGAGLLLVAAVVAAVLISKPGRTVAGALPANSLGLVDPASGQLRVSLPIAGAPARLQVSGPHVWVTSDDARTVSRVDVHAPAIAKVGQVGAFPSDFAVGTGAVWVLDREHGRLLRISPDCATVLGSSTIGSPETVSLIDDRNAVDAWSIAAGGGGVWITDGSRRLRRADPATGKIEHTYDLGAQLNGVAVGREGVWAISGPSASVLRIDPRTGAVSAPIPIVVRARPASPYPIAVAVGLGSVWVLNANTADVTRIDPSQARVTATIPLGIERVPRRLAVGDGAAWIADADGTLARIDANTNTVTTTALAPSLYDVGVGAGGVWVTSGSPIAGGSLPASAPKNIPLQALPVSQCSPIYSAPGVRPRYLIVSDLPLQGFEHDGAAQITQAIAFAVREHGFRAGRFAIGYQACDDSTATNVAGRCAANMRAYATNPSVIGVIGPFDSSCAAEEIAIANRAPGGPLAMINAASTEVGLTHRGPGSQPGEPGIYYPTGTRNFARIVASDDVQAAADALVAKQLGIRRIFITEDTLDPPYGIAIAQGFHQAAKRVGLTVAGAGNWPGRPSGDAAFARNVARTHPDGIFLGGVLFDPVAPAAPLVQALRAAMPNVQLIAPDGFAGFPDIVRLIGPAVEGMMISEPQIAPSLLRGPGQRFVAQFRTRIDGSFYPFTAYGAQAADTLLDAIARSDGTRASVTRALFATHVRNGIIGSFAFTPTGDTTAGGITIIRIKHGQPVPFTVITPTARLTTGG